MSAINIYAVILMAWKGLTKFWKQLTKKREIAMADEVLDYVKKKEVPKACLYYVTLKMYERYKDTYDEKTGEYHAKLDDGSKSLIIIPEEKATINSNDTWVGEYMNCGHLAFKSETFGGVNPFKPGDYIVYKNHRAVKTGLDGEKYVTVSHHDLYNTIEDPSTFIAI